MRILVLCYEYPPIGGGGGRVAQSVAEALAAMGHEVRVQTAALGWRSSREERNGVTIFRAGSGRRAPDTCTVLEMGLYLLTSFFPAWRLCRRWNADVVHAHFAMPTGVLAWALRLLDGIPYVLTAHLGDVPGGVPEQTDRLFRVLGPLARAVWKGAAQATAVSQFVRELAERAYGRPVELVLNGVDLSHRPARPMAVASPRRLVFVGRLNTQKNAPGLIDALALLRDLPWQLTLVGHGPDMPAVCERLARHELNSRVELTGWRSAAEVAAILDRGDVLCLPSFSEGLPVAAIEGLRHGLAIIGTDIPGLRDVLAPNVNGLASPAGNVAALAENLRAILADDALLLRFCQGSWDLAMNFDLNTVANEYFRVLLLARRPRRA